MSNNEDFQNSMENATQEIIANTIAKMQLACLQVVREAKIKCPVDMGLLRASIFSQVGFDDGKIVGRVASSSEIAPYVHQGTGLYAINGDGRKTPWGYTAQSGKYAGFHWTRGQKPNPFMEKARDENKDRIQEILTGE